MAATRHCQQSRQERISIHDSKALLPREGHQCAVGRRTFLRRVGYPTHNSYGSTIDPCCPSLLSSVMHVGTLSFFEGLIAQLRDTGPTWSITAELGAVVLNSFLDGQDHACHAVPGYIVVQPLICRTNDHVME